MRDPNFSRVGGMEAINQPTGGRPKATELHSFRPVGQGKQKSLFYIVLSHSLFQIPTP